MLKITLATLITLCILNGSSAAEEVRITPELEAKGMHLERMAREALRERAKRERRELRNLSKRERCQISGRCPISGQPGIGYRDSQ